MRLLAALLGSSILFAPTAILFAQPAQVAQSEAWDTHHQAARKALNQRNYDVAEKEIDAEFKEVQKAGPSDPRYGRSLLDRSVLEARDNTWRAQNTLRAAIDGAERAGAFAKDTTLANDLRRELISRVRTLAGNAGGQNAFAEALVYRREALLQAGRISPPDTNLMWAQAHDLGVALTNDGYYKLAESATSRALAIKEDPLTLTNLTMLYIRMGRYTEAQAMLDRAITLDASADTKAPPPSSVAFGRVLRLAQLSNQTGQYDVAEAVLKQAAQAKLNAGAEEAFHQQMGNADCGRGRLDSAMDHFRQALELNKNRTHNEKGVDRGEMILDMGTCVARKGDPAEAADYFAESQGVFEKALRPGHPLLAQVIWRQALLLEAKKNPAVAEPMLTSAIASLEAAEGNDSPILAQAWDDAARIRRAMTKPAAAQEALARANAIRAKWKNAVPSPAPAALAIPELTETLYWESLQAHESPALYRQYLRDFPKGQFASLARQRNQDRPAGGAPCNDNFVDLASKDLRACTDYWSDAGYFPSALAAYKQSLDVFFVGAFQKGSSRTVSALLTLEEFEHALEENRAKGLAPATITQLDDPQNPRFTVTWKRRDAAAEIASGPVNDVLAADIQNRQSRGMVNTLFFVYGTPDPKYVAVWELVAGTESRVFVDAGAESQSPLQRMPKQQFRPAQAIPYGNKRVEVWLKTVGYNPSWFTLTNPSKTGYLTSRDDMLSKGFSLVTVVVTGARFHSIWMRL